MKRFAAVLIFSSAIFIVAQSASAQAWSQAWARERLEKSSRHHEWVTVKHGGRNVETFVAYPESKEKRPVVLIIHEIFGLSDWAQELADEIAAAAAFLCSDDAGFITGCVMPVSGGSECGYNVHAPVDMADAQS